MNVGDRCCLKTNVNRVGKVVSKKLGAYNISLCEVLWDDSNEIKTYQTCDLIEYSIIYPRYAAVKWRCIRCGEDVVETKHGKRCGCITSPSPWVLA